MQVELQGRLSLKIPLIWKISQKFHIVKEKISYFSYKWGKKTPKQNQNCEIRVITPEFIFFSVRYSMAILWRKTIISWQK